MMNNLLISAETVIPVMLMIALGMLFRAIKAVDDYVVSKMNKVLFYGFIPCMMFKSVYGADLATLGNWKFAGFVAVSSALTYIILFIVIPRIEPVNNRRGVIIQGICRGNLPMFGTPIVLALMGEVANPVIGLAVVSQIPFNSVLSILSFELFRETRGKISIKRVLKSIVTNPIILGVAAGIIFPIFQIELPKMILSPITSLSNVVSPLSFVLLGMTINVKSMVGSHRKPLLFTVIMRLVVVPIIWLTVAYFIGFRGSEFVVLMMLFCTPTAVSSLPMAVALGGDGELSSEIIGLCSLGSLFTIFLLIFAMKSLGIA